MPVVLEPIRKDLADQLIADRLGARVDPDERRFWRWLLDEGWQEAAGVAGQNAALRRQGAFREALRVLWRKASGAGVEVDLVLAEAEDRLRLVLEDADRASTKALAGAARARAEGFAGRLPFDIAGRFDLANPDAADYARAHAAELVRYIGEQVRSQLRRHTTEAMTEGMHPQELARRLARYVPLLPHQEAAVRRREAAMAASVGARKARIAADKQARVYVEHRAATIARTELLAAANAGQDMAWRAKVADGTLPPGVMRRWIVTRDDRLCRLCRQMRGGRGLKPLAEPFSFPTATGGVRLVRQPPGHPSCRCAVGVVVPEMLTRAEIESLAR